MSNQYNNAGRSLIVDELIEIKGTKRDTVAAFKQQLDSQLLKRDTSAIRQQVAQIGADDHVSVSEKVVLAREYGNIGSTHGLIVSKGEELGITGQTGYQEYLAAYQALSAFLGAILVDMTVGSDIISHQQMSVLFDELYRTASVLEEQFFRYTTGMLGGLDYRVKFEVMVNSSLGITVPIDNTPTILSVMLLREGEDVTDEYDASAFVWERVSEDRLADSAWRDGLDLSGKTLAVSHADLVNGSSSFLCRFRYQYSDTMYYSRIGFTTLAEEVPGPPGEAAISIQIFSSNGSIFRSGQCYTTMSATVWQGELDITDQTDASKFNWERTSNDPVTDESWNTSSKAIGRKSIELTPADVVGRAVFACHVDI